jgi:hypothetical protein
MRAIRSFVSAALVTAAALVAAPSAATVVVVPTLEEMTHRSDVVAHAVVREVTVEEEKPGRLVTLTALEVLDGIAGVKTGDVLTVYQVGGEKDGRVAWIAGAHHFVVGEELVVFAVRPAALHGRIVPYGIGFSLFSVVDGVDGRRVEEIAGDVVQLQATADGKSTMSAVQPRRFATLDGFKAMLRGIVAGTNPVLPQKRILRGPVAPPTLRGTTSSPKKD